MYGCVVQSLASAATIQAWDVRTNRVECLKIKMQINANRQMERDLLSRRHIKRRSNVVNIVLLTLSFSRPLAAATPIDMHLCPHHRNQPACKADCCALEHHIVSRTAVAACNIWCAELSRHNTTTVVSAAVLQRETRYLVRRATIVTRPSTGSRLGA